ncbi:MAG TPA: TetR/AcrR family transcriptional regulator [Acidobacteriaceae bacterium]|jgi:AcrR family transcriptional regulator|nr:TetR/AcrR family transcriptional regulator [Acidobacteriaceae bacterium]
MIVEAAFKVIAKDGFEGLRTRDIARLVGINSATLHHHFPTKENLIEGVANLLLSRFRAEAAAVEDETAVEALDRQWKDAIVYYMDRPEMLGVYREFVGRAPRDPAIRRLVQRLHAGWQADVIETLKKGRNDGSFRADLDLESAARIIISTVWGLVAQIFSTKDDFKAGFHELTTWLIAEQEDKRSAKTIRRK